MFRSLIYLSSVSVLFPLVLSFIRKQYLDKALKILFCYLLVSLVVEVVATYWAFVLHKSNHFMLNAFAVIECILISLMFSQVFVSTRLKTLTLSITTTFTIFSIALFSYAESFFVFNSTISTVACLLINTWVFVYYYQVLQNPKKLALFKVPMFWISIGCSIYFSGTLFVFLYGEIILLDKSKTLYQNLWIIYYILLFIFRTLLAIGIWFSKTPLQSSPSSRPERQ